METRRVRGFVRFGIALAVVFGAIPAFAQTGWIQGKVIDEQGQAVAGADVEATIVSITNVDFAVRSTDQTWRARTNASGDYNLTVPQAGEYVVTATKGDVGSSRVKIAVRGNGIVTANLTLWKAPDKTVAAADCGASGPIDAYKHNPLVTGAEAGLGRLAAWLEAVRSHTPGCSDAAALEVGRLPLRDLETLLRDIRELVAFLHRAETRRLESILFLYGRRLTLDELERGFFGGLPLRPNDLLLRGAILHADTGIFVPGDFGRYPLAEDGGGRGWKGGSTHWEAGRQLIDEIAPAAGSDRGALLWYRAISAYLFRTGNLAELAVHLTRARAVFPRNADILLDSAYLHQELSTPAIQASADQLRATAVSVAISSRRDELQRAERFFREVLALAPANANARMRLGHTLGELGRHKEAAAELRTAIDARPERRDLYLSALFLARDEEALGRRDEARRWYQEAATLYPGAQSPQLALSGLARRGHDLENAQRSLHNLAAVSTRESIDPWWEFYQPHKHDAEALMSRLRQAAIQ